MIGLSDGLTVPFALAAGLSSLGTSRIVVMGGVAELIAGAISMGIGGYLASQAERDHFRYQQRALADRVRNSCSGELDRGVYRVLGPVGVDAKTCRSVTECLKGVEQHFQGGTPVGDVENSRQKWDHTVGLTAFLLKFELGLGMNYECRVGCVVDWVFLRRSAEQEDVYIRVHDWHGVSYRRNYSVDTVFRYTSGSESPDLFVDNYGGHSAHIWGCEGEGDGCREEAS